MKEGVYPIHSPSISYPTLPTDPTPTLDKTFNMVDDYDNEKSLSIITDTLPHLITPKYPPPPTPCATNVVSVSAPPHHNLSLSLFSRPLFM